MCRVMGLERYEPKIEDKETTSNIVMKQYRDLHDKVHIDAFKGKEKDFLTMDAQKISAGGIDWSVSCSKLVSHTMSDVVVRQYINGELNLEDRTPSPGDEVTYKEYGGNYNGSIQFNLEIISSDRKYKYKPEITVVPNPELFYSMSEFRDLPALPDGGVYVKVKLNKWRDDLGKELPEVCLVKDGIYKVGPGDFANNGFMKMIERIADHNIA